jgi:hypothetical protein
MISYRHIETHFNESILFCHLPTMSRPNLFGD